MSLNLNCAGRLEVDGPHPPSGLSLICGSEKEDILRTESVSVQTRYTKFSRRPI